MGATPTLDMPIEEQIKLFARIGFEGFFTSWERGMPVKKYKELGDALGTEYQSIHAPCQGVADISKMWDGGERAALAAKELCLCLEACSENEIKIMVSHVFWGFDYLPPDRETAERGLEFFGIVADRALELGVTVAFENTEGEEFLAVLMDGFYGHRAVGFCWDSGHEQCYSKGKDLLGLYGDRLAATHLNDNLGVASFNGRITDADDLHLLPFDGIIDWTNAMERLDRSGFDGILTFEVKRKNHVGRHESDIYSAMPPEMYAAEAYKRACRLAALKNRDRK